MLLLLLLLSSSSLSLLSSLLFSSLWFARSAFIQYPRKGPLSNVTLFLPEICVLSASRRAQLLGIVDVPMCLCAYKHLCVFFLGGRARQVVAQRGCGQRSGIQQGQHLLGPNHCRTVALASSSSTSSTDTTAGIDAGYDSSTWRLGRIKGGCRWGA